MFFKRQKTNDFLDNKKFNKIVTNIKQKKNENNLFLNNNSSHYKSGTAITPSVQLYLYQKIKHQKTNKKKKT